MTLVSNAESFRARAAGQSIVYLFGGVDDQGGAVFGTSAYNVSTDTWGGRPGATVQAFAANGVGKIADRLYFGGGYNEEKTPSSFTNLF